MLDMLRAKTDGNLNADEKRLLEHVLYQLRMNYVDVAKAEEAGEGAASSAEGAEPKGAEPEGGSGDSPGAPSPDSPGGSSDDAPSDEEDEGA